MIVKLPTEHHLECLSLEGGCRDSSESTHVKMPHCWKSHALAQIISAHAFIRAHYYLFRFEYDSTKGFRCLITSVASGG